MGIESTLRNPHGGMSKSLALLEEAVRKEKYESDSCGAESHPGDRAG